MSCFQLQKILSHYLIDTFMWLTPPWPYRATICRERELIQDHIHIFLTTQGHGGPPRTSDQLSAGATSETTQTWKTIHTIHAPIHSNKANMKGWLWRPDDIRGPCGPDASWHLSDRWGKNLEKTSTRKLLPIWDRTRARCVTGAHATVCSTMVDRNGIYVRKLSPSEFSAL